MSERLPCEQVEVGIADFLDGALPRALQRRFEAHLGSCEECGDLRRRIGRTLGHLAGLPREAMPPGMKVRLLLARRGTGCRATGEPGPRRRGGRAPAPAAGGAS